MTRTDERARVLFLGPLCLALAVAYYVVPVLLWGPERDTHIQMERSRMKMILSEAEILTALRDHFELDPGQTVQLCVTRSRGAARPTYSAEVTDPETADLDRALVPSAVDLAQSQAYGRDKRRRRKPTDETSDAPPAAVTEG